MLSDATPDSPHNYLTFLLLTAIETGKLPEGVDLEQLVSDYRQTRYIIDVLLIGLAVKDHDTVQLEAQKLQKALPKSFDAAIELRFTKKRLQHLAKLDPPEDWLLEQASSSGDVSDANFQTALVQWAHEDVETSKKYFQATLDSDFSYWKKEYHWARALLKSVSSK